VINNKKVEEIKLTKSLVGETTYFMACNKVESYLAWTIRQKERRFRCPYVKKQNNKTRHQIIRKVKRKLSTSNRDKGKEECSATNKQINARNPCSTHMHKYVYIHAYMNICTKKDFAGLCIKVWNFFQGSNLFI
jgi:hypothetical protein